MNEHIESGVRKFYENCELSVPDSRKHLRFLRCSKRMKKIFDRVYSVEQFRSHLLRIAPLRVWSSVAYYLNPTIVWKKRFDGAVMLYTDMLLEEDFEELRDAKVWVKKLWAWLDFNYPQYEKNLLFSGGKGFHIKLIKWDRPVVSIIPCLKKRVEVIKQMRNDLCDEIEKAGITLDRDVCVDERRVSAVPYTIHNSGNLVEPLTIDMVDDFVPKKVLNIKLESPISMGNVLDRLKNLTGGVKDGC